ncbi:wall-associated receptor kinase 5 isoform X2 [Arachis hypogaea]|uniref:wall-associated receptor kinase 5 isoform X2 n=1 Tax=Arachis hypogaea TaxID=3818 RepID=UPI003B21FB49
MCAIHSSNLLLFLLVLLWMVFVAAAQLGPNCKKSSNCCGNVNIPFPFGTTKESSLAPEFLIHCTNHVPYLASDLQVLSISVDPAELRVSLPVASDCYQNNTSKNNETDQLFFFENYSISWSRNVFLTVGCDTLGIVVGYSFPHSGRSKPYAKTCLSYCQDFGDAKTGSCTGTGCCRINIPEPEVKEEVLTVISYSFENSLLNNSRKIEFNACGYAFVAEEKGGYEFVSSDLKNNEFKNTEFPVVLDWSVGNQTCEEAKKKNSSYACKGPNTTCQPSEKRPGYLCKCLPGFQGNPYHHDGCLEGISVCVIALLVACSSIYCALKKRKLIKLKEHLFQQNGGLLLQQQIATHHQGSTQTAKVFSVEELKKATNNFDECNVLGQGGQGTVYKGLLLDNRVVAIKMSKISDISQVEHFINEVVVLSQINHRNVVKLLGCCLETKVPLLVYEFVPNGTIHDHLHSYTQISSELTWKVRLRIAAETAEALAYLHFATSIPIIHRDVKTSNILLDRDLTAKVSDFGASRIVPLDKTQITTLVQGTLGYLDPEYFHTSKLTEKSDVYSFGVVLAELLTARKALAFDVPEDEKNLAKHFVRSMEEGRLLEIVEKHIVEEAKEEALAEFGNIALRCLKLKGEERPSMKQVAMELERLRVEECGNNKVIIASSSAFHVEDGSGVISDISTGVDALNLDSMSLLGNGR